MKRLFIFLFSLNGICLFGQEPVENFSLPNVTDGSIVSLNSYDIPVVILFTSNVCPYDQYYTARIKRLIEVYQGKIQFLLINSYQEPEESVDKMKLTFPSWTLSVPYLADKDQMVMARLGAKKSPEVFLLKKLNATFTVVYNGAFDDNAQVSAAVTETYLRNAIDNVLAEKPINTPMIRAVGCTIRKK